ncbi:sensor histidine kinase [Wenzhouxiangella marina]|nr:histidine kinase [Wenzhouxiangella marina]MBB6088205.1 signal transduction histidine kinase [Wenzhouxiangella marina]
MDSFDLNQHLPAEVAAGRPGWWLAYRRYPVFSWPWVWRRALFIGLFILAWGALSGLGHYAAGGSASEATELSLVFVLGFAVMVNAGPLLAAGVRHGLPTPRFEQGGVLLALLVGLVLAFLADSWSSGRIMAITGERFDREMSGSALLLNWLVLLVLYSLIGGGLALRAYLSEGRRLAEFRQQQALADLRADKLATDQQLAVLQAQVEPHFLFNTLASIRSELRRSPDQAEQTLDALCDYLRSAIPRLRDGSASAASTLVEQVELCRHYLDVMRGRMGERLSCRIDMEEALNPVAFPPFLLLSLVENAIKHGLEPKPEGGEVIIRVEALTESGDRLRVEVIDSGVGLGHTVGHGVGLSNVHEQLRLRYGDAARLRLESRPGGGVRASIELPMESPS